MTPLSPQRRIRRAQPGEARQLADLQSWSSTHWGYSSEFFDWAPGAHIIPEAYVRDNPVYLLEDEGRVVGFYGFTEEEGELLLDKLFVDMDDIGTGCGKLLWLHAVNRARDLGRTHFVIGSDPNAASFYAAMGAVWYAAKPTPEPRWTAQMLRYGIPSLTIRPATPTDADTLHALTQRSTMHWGYEPDFLDWEPEAIAVTPSFLETAVAWVAEADGSPLGYFALVDKPDGLYLDKLFVDPAAIGTGIGKRLWQHATMTAHDMGATVMRIEADPNAAAFYRAMGAEWIGEIETSWPDWRLQVLRYELEPATTGKE